jgi:hypothetical protein
MKAQRSSASSRSMVQLSGWSFVVPTYSGPAPAPYPARACFTALSTPSSSLRIRHKHPSSSLSAFSCNLTAACPRPSRPLRIKTFSSPVVCGGNWINPSQCDIQTWAQPTFEWRLVCRENTETPREPKALKTAHDRIQSAIVPPSCRECRCRIPHIPKIVTLLTLLEFSSLVWFRLGDEGVVEGDQIGAWALFVL